MNVTCSNVGVLREDVLMDLMSFNIKFVMLECPKGMFIINVQHAGVMNVVHAGVMNVLHASILSINFGFNYILFHYIRFI